MRRSICKGSTTTIRRPVALFAAGLLAGLLVAPAVADVYTWNGPVTLNSDGSFGVSDWTNNGVGSKRLFFIDSVIADGTGGPHNVYFLGDLSSTYYPPIRAPRAARARWYSAPLARTVAIPI